MDKKLKAKWVKALRSGRYSQINCALYSESADAYCCLGVLGVVIGKPKAILAGDTTASTPKAWHVLPQNVVDTLIDMNDSKEKSFVQIAKYIERVL